MKNYTLSNTSCWQLFASVAAFLILTTSATPSFFGGSLVLTLGLCAGLFFIFIWLFSDEYALSLTILFFLHLLIVYCFQLDQCALRKGVYFFYFFLLAFLVVHSFFSIIVSPFSQSMFSPITAVLGCFISCVKPIWLLLLVTKFSYLFGDGLHMFFYPDYGSALLTHLIDPNNDPNSHVRLISPHPRVGGGGLFSLIDLNPHMHRDGLVLSWGLYGERYLDDAFSRLTSVLFGVAAQQSPSIVIDGTHSFINSGPQQITTSRLFNGPNHQVNAMLLVHATVLPWVEHFSLALDNADCNFLYGQFQSRIQAGLGGLPLRARSGRSGPASFNYIKEQAFDW